MHSSHLTNRFDSRVHELSMESLVRSQLVCSELRTWLMGPYPVMHGTIHQKSRLLAPLMVVPSVARGEL
jgi:hypothetical protein